MDIIFLHGLEVETVIGVFDWEREITQKLVIDLEMASDIASAAATDQLGDTLDYKAVSKRVRSWAENHHPLLVETVAENIAKIVRDEFSVPWLRVTVNKPGAITGARDVGVVIERGTRT